MNPRRAWQVLRHVVEKKLNGEGNSLKKYSIGLEVFQRGIKYDPKSDAVVRVQATLAKEAGCILCGRRRERPDHS